MIVFPITDAALRWLEVILAERFGQAWQLAPTAEGLRLQLAGAEGAILFDTLCEGFTQAHSDQPFTRWEAEREGWSSVLGGPLPAPGVADLPSPLIEPRGAEQVIHYDILGLTYWMLTRVEEIGRTDLDKHGRFPSTASHAFKHDYLDRPVVDEWLYLLRQVIQRQWPGIELKQHTARTLVSCDVDSPFSYRGDFKKLPRKIAGHIIKRRNFLTAWQDTLGEVNALRGDFSKDIFRLAIDWIMEVNESAGNQVAFYFIPTNTDRVYDNRYSLDELGIRNTIRAIHLRGHEVGIHPGYNTYNSADLMRHAVKNLRRVMIEERIDQPVFGGRQHYLRCEMPTTTRLWSENGLDYDTSLGYADRPGFRCGTCFEYPMFDGVNQRALRLRERPLVLMECSVISDVYLGLGYGDQALEEMKRHRDCCYRVGGNFTLL